MNHQHGQVAAAKTSRSRRLIILLTVASVFTFALAGLALFAFFGRSGTVAIPETIVNSVKWPIYLPSKLPGNYQLRASSFVFSEGVLVFQADDDTGGTTIAFTEQPRPKAFDFDAFYSQQVIEAKTLDNVPFPSIAGKTQDGKTRMLSMVTGDTWIMATSQSPLDDNGMQVIAQNLKRY